ncbi:MAG: type II toxin-antitoxin system RelE/ParE family toxin [Saprospiraceae bacterium]|jgi:toxin ParE1/3/4|nr:type II toxin-antitoxin system RelE/ParE family toxin [Saprospiraceae bacterium]
MKFLFELSNLAKTDLEEIWIYTVNEWSIRQANSYYKFIISKIEDICKNPAIGKSIANIKQNHKVLKVKSHLIVYQIKDEKIWIDRILHKSMDVETRIKN